LSFIIINNNYYHSGHVVDSTGSYTDYGWRGGTTGSASDQRSEGCEFEAY